MSSTRQTTGYNPASMDPSQSPNAGLDSPPNQSSWQEDEQADIAAGHGRMIGKSGKVAGKQTRNPATAHSQNSAGEVKANPTRRDREEIREVGGETAEYGSRAPRA